MNYTPVFFCSRPVSRILCRIHYLRKKSEPASIIYLVLSSLAGSYDLPPGTGRAALLPVYMVFQPIRCTAPGVAAGTGELLPRLFTLPPRAKPRGRLFSVTLLYPHGYLPVRKYGALRCPDFPFRHDGYRDRTMERPAAEQRY
jgi:hypothetical protein